MTTASFIKASIKREDNLFSQVYAFNQLISRYIDESHLFEFPYLLKYWESLKKITRIQKKLSNLLLKNFKLENKSFYNFEDPRLRIALLDAKTLKNLLLYAGAVLYSERINKIILKKDLLSLKESIGEDLYFFAAKKASLLIGFVPKIELSKNGVAIQKEDLFEAGKECLQLCLAQEDENLTERLILKFSKEITWNFNLPASEEQKTKSWNFLYKILVKEVNSEVKQCFT